MDASTALDSHGGRLLALARQAAEQAYAPYSRFRVGAAVAVVTSSGLRVVTGANVENASYGLALCAERAALAAACALPDATRPTEAAPRVGSHPDITHVALACIDAPADAPPASRMPCGACRQWFAELAPHATFYIDGMAGPFTLADLLPQPFQLGSSGPAESEQ
ncbi:MAG TPA: cytidine deaminase [Ktedonobacterales bacterium]|jgi:cytidine deaminase|nr:cytidine deaminase [Ktedonobacterales bacterium]